MLFVVHNGCSHEPSQMVICIFWLSMMMNIKRREASWYLLPLSTLPLFQNKNNIQGNPVFNYFSILYPATLIAYL